MVACFSKVRRMIPAMALMVGLAACSDTAGTGTANLTVLLTDAPTDYLDSAQVTIGEVAILPDDGAPIVLTDDGGTFDLLSLQNGVTATLAELEIEPGVYHQLRLVVTAAEVTLADGHTFTDGTSTRALTVPSGAQTGIKINLDAADGDPESAGVSIAPGETILVLDFDALQSFVLQGNPMTPAGIVNVHFQPLIRASVRDIAGSIAGVVLDTDSIAVVDTIVRATLQESGVLEELQTAEATAVTDSTGAYVIRFLSPGTYDVFVDGLDADTLTVDLGEGENATGVDFVEN